MNTIVAGTFDKFHKGHRALLDAAIKVTGNDSLCIGITTEELLRNKNHPVSDFSIRLNEVYDYVKGKVKFTMIDVDKTVPLKALEASIECVVCSTETYHNALFINHIRECSNIPQILIVVVPLIIDDGGRKISTTNIYDGWINKEGKYV